MFELTDEYRAIAKEYKRLFGYGVPLSMIPPTIETSDLISKIKECVCEQNDNLLEKYGVTVDEYDLM